MESNGLNPGEYIIPSLDGKSKARIQFTTEGKPIEFIVWTLEDELAGIRTPLGQRPHKPEKKRTWKSPLFGGPTVIYCDI